MDRDLRDFIQRGGYGSYKNNDLMIMGNIDILKKAVMPIADFVESSHNHDEHCKGCCFECEGKHDCEVDTSANVSGKLSE